MARTKAKRMAALADLPTALAPSEVLECGGMAACFAVQRPLILEIGSGKGESLVAMASVDGDHNHVGIDLKSARLWCGARSALARGLDNVLFVKAEAKQLWELCGRDSVDAIWLPFPDPVSRGSKAHKRLVSPHHLWVYGRVLRPGSRIHLKTDDDALFAYALDVLSKTQCPVHSIVSDIRTAPPAGYPAHAQSTYERRYAALGRAIHYVCFELARELAPEEAGLAPRTQRQARISRAFAGPRAGAPPIPPNDSSTSRP